MAKPKAEPWLREAFADGVDAYTREEVRGITRPYTTANVYCWLARFDPARRPCSPGPLERFHFIRRQDVERAVGDALVACDLCDFGAIGTPVEYTVAACCGRMTSTGECCGEPIPELAVDYDVQPCPACEGIGIPSALRTELILLAAWDPRNGGHACEEHHRRYDSHQVSLPRDRLIVPYSALPSRVVQFGFDYSEGRLLDRFPSSI